MPQTNVVNFRINKENCEISNEEFIDKLISKRIYVSVYAGDDIRAVFHMDITNDDMNYIYDAISSILDHELN